MLVPEQRVIFYAAIESVQNNYSTAAKVFIVNAFPGSVRVLIFNTL